MRETATGSLHVDRRNRHTAGRQAVWANGEFLVRVRVEVSKVSTVCLEKAPGARGNHVWVCKSAMIAADFRTTYMS